MKGLLLLAALLLALTGCAHVVSRAGRDAASPDLTLADLARDPAALSGKTVLLGGVITANLADVDGSALELSPWTLDCFGEPVAYAEAPKRLIAVTEQCLDRERFLPGRLVTLVATVTGRARPGGAGEPALPEIRIVEIYLWDTPYRYGQHPSSDPYLPAYAPAWYERDNPYDPGFAPFPFTPLDLPRPR